MKKIFYSFFLVAIAFLFFGCEFGDAVTGPRDVWCKRELKVQGVEFDCYLLYTENGYEHSDLNENAFEDGKIQPGLTVVLKPQVDNDIFAAFTSDMYTVKHFPLGNETDALNGNIPEDGTITVGNVLWNTIWLGNITTFTTNGTLKNPPYFMSKSSELDFTFVKEKAEQIKNLSWQEVVIALLEKTI